MNISYDLLRSYVSTDLTPEEVAAALTSIGLETGSIEQVESIPGGLKGLVIGKVLTCDVHENSNRLWRTQCRGRQRCRRSDPRYHPSLG